VQIDLQTDANTTVTIADVARAAGVSATTVSHVVSGKRKVNEQTAEQVRTAMRDLGYVPHHAARSLRRGASQTLGLLVPDIANPFFAELARGVEDAADQAGYRVVLCNTDFNVDREQRSLDVLRAGGADGLIWAPARTPRGQGPIGTPPRLPIVLVDEARPGDPHDAVVSDNRLGGRLAGEHLRDLGHRDILIVDGPEHSPSNDDRRAGFEAAFTELPGRREFRRGDFRAPSVAPLLEPELDADDRWYSAIFAANDVMGVAAMNLLRARGVRVPEDVSVMGYDDAPLAELVHPGLSTVRQHVHELGRSAAQRLLRHLGPDRPTHAERIELGVELVIRQSTTQKANSA
jgi:LacI family transcriptional regulator